MVSEKGGKPGILENHGGGEQVDNMFSDMAKQSRLTSYIKEDRKSTKKETEISVIIALQHVNVIHSELKIQNTSVDLQRIIKS